MKIGELISVGARAAFESMRSNGLNKTETAIIEGVQAAKVGIQIATNRPHQEVQPGVIFVDPRPASNFIDPTEPGARKVASKYTAAVTAKAGTSVKTVETKGDGPDFVRQHVAKDIALRTQYGSDRIPTAKPSEGVQATVVATIEGKEDGQERKPFVKGLTQMAVLGENLRRKSKIAREERRGKIVVQATIDNFKKKSDAELSR